MKLKYSLVFFTVLLASAVTLALHASIILNIRFIADDYCSAYLGQRLGLLRYIWFWYLSWGGRYAAIVADMALVWVRPQHLGIVTLSILAIWMGSLTVIFYSAFQHLAFRWRVLVSLSISFSLVYTLITLLPNIAQSLYWYSAFRTHFLPIIVLCLHLSIYIFYRYTTLQGIRDYIFILGAGFGFSVFNAGFSEAFTLTQIVFWGLVVLLEYLNRSVKWIKLVYFSTLCMAGGISGILIMLFAPGNANRQDAYRQPEGIFETLTISVNGYFYFWNQLISSPEKIFSILGILLLALFVGWQYPKISKISFKWTLLPFFAGAALAFASFVPSAYGIAKILPDRGFPVPTFFLLSGSWMTLFLLGNALPFGFSKPKTFIASLGVVFFIVSTVFSGSTLMKSLPIYLDYAQKFDQVETQIAAHKAADQVSIAIPKLNNWAGAFDPNENPNFWVTHCVSKYYDIQVFGPPDSK